MIPTLCYVKHNPGGMTGSKWQRRDGVFFVCAVGIVVVGVSGFRLDERTTEINVVYQFTKRHGGGVGVGGAGGPEGGGVESGIAPRD